MNIFKLRQGDEPFYFISTAVVEQTTEKHYPYYQKNEKGLSIQFAICPACDNPVQFVGLYTNSHIQKELQYARHTRRDLPEIANYVHENYLYCPLHKESLKADKGTRRAGLPEISLNILKAIILKFDKICYFLEKETGMLIGEKLAKKMLENYINDQGYNFIQASRINIPLMFAYFCGTHSMYMRNFQRNKDLMDKIEQILGSENVNYDEWGNFKPKQYTDISFCFRNYEYKFQDNHLTESLIFSVSIMKNGHIESIYQKKISLDPKYVQNLLNYTSNDEKIIHLSKKKISWAKESIANYPVCNNLDID